MSIFFFFTWCNEKDETTTVVVLGLLFTMVSEIQVADDSHEFMNVFFVLMSFVAL